MQLPLAADALRLEKEYSTKDREEYQRGDASPVLQGIADAKRAIARWPDSCVDSSEFWDLCSEADYKRKKNKWLKPIHDWVQVGGAVCVFRCVEMCLCRWMSGVDVASA